MGMVVKNLLIISMVWLFQTANSPKTILFYGDSLTAGYGLSPEEAFPAIVGQRLGEKGKQNKGKKGINEKH